VLLSTKFNDFSQKSGMGGGIAIYIDYLNKEIKGLQGPNSTFGVCETLKPWNFEIILSSFESSHYLHQLAHFSIKLRIFLRTS